MTPACPPGFRATGIACGIKADGSPDLALIVADSAVPVAAVFTRNQVQAAPVQVSRAHLGESGGRARALVINSGNANAATGAEGLRHARDTVEAVAAALQEPPSHILVNSTGVIGHQLPVGCILDRVGDLPAACVRSGLADAAVAIMTTDTRPKLAERTVGDGEHAVHVVGIAKGSGMIHPDMATMIGVLLTDADVDAPTLDTMLRRAVDTSFHRISVDGDTSTNDAVFAMASGAAGVVDADRLQTAFDEVARDLALQIVRDGEGARRLIHVQVSGASDQAAARQVAQTIAGSALVRTAVTGGDPNWGRILAAVGYSGVAIDADCVIIRADGATLFADGRPLDPPLDGVFANDKVSIEVDLNAGTASDEFFTCDLTEEYVRINAEYTT